MYVALLIYPLAAHPKAVPYEDREAAANYALASRLFNKIAAEVIAKKYKARLEKDAVESILFTFKEPNQQIPKIFKDILSLYGENVEEIRILSNNDLNRRLVQLAAKLSSYITKANKDVISNIKNVFDYN